MISTIEIMRCGRFAVLDVGISDLWEREAAADRPRYAVVEHDVLGPILRAGPFRTPSLAIERCQQLAFQAELTDVS